MRGRKRVSKREIEVEPQYHNLELAQFINKVMIKGKKALARRTVYHSLERASSILKVPPLEIFEKAIANVTPLVETRPRRIGGATYQVPMEVERNRGKTLAMRWIVQVSRVRQGKTFEEFLAQELMDAYQNKGEAVSKRDKIHKLAEQNKAFAHYARF